MRVWNLVRREDRKATNRAPFPYLNHRSSQTLVETRRSIVVTRQPGNRIKRSILPVVSRYFPAPLATILHDDNYIALRRMPITRRTRMVMWKFPTCRSNSVGSASRAQFAFLVLHASILAARFRLSAFRRDIPAGFDRHALGSICRTRMRCLRHAEEAMRWRAVH